MSLFLCSAELWITAVNEIDATNLLFFFFPIQRFILSTCFMCPVSCKFSPPLSSILTVCLIYPLQRQPLYFIFHFLPLSPFSPPHLVEWSLLCKQFYNVFYSDVCMGMMQSIVCISERFRLIYSSNYWKCLCCILLFYPCQNTMRYCI